MNGKLLQVLGVLVTLIAVTVLACTDKSTPTPIRTVTSAVSTPSQTQTGPIFGWTYQGELRQGAVDATTYVLPDGTYRQIYGSTLLDGTMAAASSKDGLHWTEEGKAGFPQWVGGRVAPTRDGRYLFYSGSGKLRVFSSAEGKTWQEEPQGSLRAPDPDCNRCGYASSDVAIMPDGSYRMFYEQREPSPFFPDGGVSTIANATSADGLVWQKDPSWRSEVLMAPEIIAGPTHPRVIKLPDGTYKMFYAADSAVMSVTSRDGQTWTGRKFENVMGGDPDALVLPDGRIVLHVNWRDLSMPTKDPAVQRMWSYIWQQVPFAFEPASPKWNTIRPGETLSITLPIVGAPGKDLRYTTTVYSNSVFAIDDPKSPVKVQLTATPGANAVQLTISAPQGSPSDGGSVVIVADDGTTRVSTFVRYVVNIGPARPG